MKLTKKFIERLTPKEISSKAWRNAGDEYSALYESRSLPNFLNMGKPLTDKDYIDELQKIIDLYPSFYPAYFDLGVRLLTSDMENATEILDTAFEMCYRIGSWDTISKDYDLVFDNLEKIYHEEFMVRYSLKLIEKFPNKAILYDYAAYGYNILNQDDKAIEYGLKAVEIEPKSTYFLNNLGLYYLSDKKFDEAEKYFNLSINANSEHENPKNNMIDLKKMKKLNLSLKEFYLLPIDNNQIEKYKTNDEWDEIEEYIDITNAQKLLIFHSYISENNQYKTHNYHSLLSTLQIFLKFVKSICDDPFIFENIVYFTVNFKAIIHKFIFKHGDVDDEILTEIFDSTLIFYGFLFDKNVISQKQLLEFQNISNSSKSEMFDKMHKYNKIRHDYTMSETKKESIREQLFDGDHEHPFL